MTRPGTWVALRWAVVWVGCASATALAAEPSRAQRAAPFSLRYAENDGFAGASREIVVTGDGRGAELALREVDPTRQPPVDLFRRHRLDAAATARLLAGLDATRWWDLGDDSQPVRDGTHFLLEVNRGGFAHRFQLGNGCACESPMRAAGGQTTGCECRQRAAMDALTQLAASLAGEKPLPEPETELLEFRPPPQKGKRPAVERKCRAGAEGTVVCGEARCFGPTAVKLCFKSPFPDLTPAELVTEVGLRGPAPPNLQVGETPEGALPWAVETEAGLRCTAAPDPAFRADYACAAPGPGQTSLRLAFRVGKTRYAVLKSPAEPGGSRVVAVRRAWK